MLNEREKSDRVDDALHATRAAVEEGIVAGGCVALVRAAAKVAASLKGDNEEQNVGIKLALRCDGSTFTSTRQLLMLSFIC